MIKHIVMWKLKDFAEGESKAENARKIKTLLESLKDKIKEIQHIEVGIDVLHTEASTDAALYAEFDSLEDLHAYQKHPEHTKVVQFIRGVSIERRVIDYETP